MAVSRPRSAEELLRAVELHHEQYLKSLRALHEVVFAAKASSSSAGGSRMERSASTDGIPGSPVLPAIFAPPSPLLRPVHTPASLNEAALPSAAVAAAAATAAKRYRRGTNELSERQGSVPVDRKNVPVSLYDADSDAEAEDDADCSPLALLPLVQQPSLSPRTTADPRVPSVQRPLASHLHSVEDLVGHIRRLDESQSGTAIALGEVWHKRSEVDLDNVLNPQTYVSPEHQLLYANATYEVYDVGPDALAVQQHDAHGNDNDQTLEAATVWNTLKDVNPNGSAVGRMTLLQEPSPLMLASAHLAMSRHFDMDELYQHLVASQGNKGKTKAYMYRAFEPTPIRRSTFFFVFKYYTVVGSGMAPTPWQQFDQRTPDKQQQDHIDIAECSSILALSLEGPHVKEVQIRYKKKRPVQVGYVSDAFAPWHLLSIQCFPDDRHSVRSEDVNKHFYNGPFAFLDSLSAEYRDAVKRYTKLHELIAKLITPPNQFMFDGKLRDKLLFEDAHFTYSRRYFWAYNSLGVINEGIKAMTAAYSDTFTSDFWAGRHQTLWPLRDTGSPEAINYLDKMDGLRHEIDRAVDDLRKAADRNERTRKEIANLREQLFSGSSVRESRRAIDQGDNIKLLTGVSMVFLPLTFVTSVFGITEFTIPASDWRFPVVMVCVCVPFFLLIIILQTRAGLRFVKKMGSRIDALLNGERAHDPREQKMMMLAAKVHEDQKDGRRPRRFRRGGRRRVGMSAEAGGTAAAEPAERRAWWRLRGEEVSYYQKG